MRNARDSIEAAGVDPATVALSAAGTFKLICEAATGEPLVSSNGGAFFPILPGPFGPPWVDDGAVVRLTTPADQVSIGVTVPPTGAVKLNVLATADPAAGDATRRTRAAVGQTGDLDRWETNAAAQLATVTIAGTFRNIGAAVFENRALTADVQPRMSLSAAGLGLGAGGGAALDWDLTRVAAASARITGVLGVGGTADPTAIVDMTSTTRGLGLPSMTTAQRDAIVGAKPGLLIFNTTTGKLNFRNAAGAWEVVTSA